MEVSNTTTTKVCAFVHGRKTTGSDFGVNGLIG